MFGSKLISFVLLAGAAFQAVSATTVNTPGTGTVWQSNSMQDITWSNPSESLCDVRLVQGSPQNLQFVALLCQKVPCSAGKCRAKVPVVNSNINYAVTVGTDASKYGYSSYFDIKGNGPMPKRTGCPKMGGQNCPHDLPCCSASGYCGSTPGHCGQGCMPQYSFNGVCAKPGSNPPPKPPQKCGKQTCSKTKPCCNKKTNTCTNTLSGCKNCIAKKSFKGKCKRYHP